ncbi:unnamed protein product [Rhodiola kirilowii]
MSDAIAKDTTISFSSPYYLHPSDHPGLFICPVIFIVDNYDEWVITMRNSLCAKQKLDFIDGSLNPPAASETTPPTIDDWSMVISMLVSWVIQSIDSSLCSTITYFDNVKDLWDDLRQHFCVGNGPRKLQLRSEIARCRQSGLSVAAYYNTLKKLWDELAAHVPLRNYSCGKCTCNLNSFWTQEREEERVHQFLIGLDDVSFRTLRSNLMALDPMPPLNRVYALAIQEERLKMVVLSLDSSSDTMALAARHHRPSAASSSLSGSSSQRKFITCDHCGRKGHEKTACFKLNGYLDWMKERWATRDAARYATRATSKVYNTRPTQPTEGVVNAINTSSASATPPLSSSDRSFWPISFG